MRAALPQTQDPLLELLERLELGAHDRRRVAARAGREGSSAQNTVPHVQWAIM